MTYFINYKKEFTKLTETLIVNGVVIANGIADSDGDILDKKDIKTIFMKYQRDTDTMHTSIKNDGVEVFASWISEVDTIIKGQNVPAGSWLATFKITNPNLIQCIENGKLQGLSLGSVSEKAMTPKYWFINKSLNYRDIKNIEEVIPLFISFVDKPANQYGFDVMTYDAYINKNEKDVKMTGENQEAMIPVSALDKLRDFFTITKAEEEAPVDEATVEETTADETVTALFEKLDMIIEQNNQILEAINKADSEEEEPVDEEEEIEKADSEDEEASEEKEDEEVEKADSESEKKDEASEDDEKIEKSETEEETETEDDTHIDKRQTNMIENQNRNDNSTFYQKTGRDHLGRKIRK